VDLIYLTEWVTVVTKVSGWLPADPGKMSLIASDRRLKLSNLVPVLSDGTLGVTMGETHLTLPSSAGYPRNLLGTLLQETQVANIGRTQRRVIWLRIATTVAPLDSMYLHELSYLFDTWGRAAMILGLPETPGPEHYLATESPGALPVDSLSDKDALQAFLDYEDKSRHPLDPALMTALYDCCMMFDRFVFLHSTGIRFRELTTRVTVETRIECDVDTLPSWSPYDEDGNRSCTVEEGPASSEGYVSSIALRSDIAKDDLSHDCLARLSYTCFVGENSGYSVCSPNPSGSVDYRWAVYPRSVSRQITATSIVPQKESSDVLHLEFPSESESDLLYYRGVVGSGLGRPYGAAAFEAAFLIIRVEVSYDVGEFYERIETRSSCDNCGMDYDDIPDPVNHDEWKPPVDLSSVRSGYYAVRVEDILTYPNDGQDEHRTVALVSKAALMGRVSGVTGIPVSVLTGEDPVTGMVADAFSAGEDGVKPLEPYTTPWKGYDPFTGMKSALADVKPGKPVPYVEGATEWSTCDDDSNCRKGEPWNYSLSANTGSCSITVGIDDFIGVASWSPPPAIS
jgi:hypothetical protein